ncbi:hypothetical protein [Streptomyces sp. H34-S4]|uniref:hypothetical protein n=1 Tax=Streptomyces sp. H34-S4 TaxID=2996463 RepID=UPI002D1E399C|nr:hypothetical protein [Streptomyces sp. H34-S4]
MAEVDALAEAIGIRWRLMVYLGAYGPARPEEQAALRWHDVDLANVGVLVRSAEPDLNTGKRAPGETKSEAGKRFTVLRDFMRGDLKLHMHLCAEQQPDGLLFMGEPGGPFRRTTFGRK